MKIKTLGVTKKKRFRILFIIPIIFIVISPFLIKIKNVECQSQYGGCAQAVTEIIEGHTGSGLFFAKSAIETELKKEKIISMYSVRYVFPNKLRVNVIQKKARYAIKGDMYYLIDDKGFVISKNLSTSLPALEYPDFQIAIGEKIDAKDFFALNLLNKLHYVYKLQNPRKESGGIFFNIDNAITLIYPHNGDVDVLVGATRLIMSKLDSNREEFILEKPDNQITIDLRYKNPIIR